MGKTKAFDPNNRCNAIHVLYVVITVYILPQLSFVCYFRSCCSRVSHGKDVGGNGCGPLWHISQSFVWRSKEICSKATKNGVQLAPLMPSYHAFVMLNRTSGHYMYHQWSLYVPPVVNICTTQWSLYVPPVVVICTCTTSLTFNSPTHVWPTQCIYVFCVDLRTNSDYFPIQH